MKTAIPVWGDRISPVFDSARKLLIAEIENQKITSRRYEPFDPDLPYRLTERLNELDIGVFLCGAISTIPANTIELSGVELISFISGNVDEILQEYAAGRPIIPAYLMPGCKCRHRMRKNRDRMACSDQERKKSGRGLKKYGNNSRSNREPGRRGQGKGPHK